MMCLFYWGELKTTCVHLSQLQVYKSHDNQGVLGYVVRGTPLTGWLIPLTSGVFQHLQYLLFEWDGWAHTPCLTHLSLVCSPGHFSYTLSIAKSTLRI